MRNTHVYEEMKVEERLQDNELDGSGLTVETSEHGGEYCDAFPNCLTVTDEEGRSCKYVPITVNGKVVKSKGFHFDSGTNFPETLNESNEKYLTK